MQIWSAEIKELESLYTSIKGRFPELVKELERLVEAYDENMILLYSRRCLEVIITDLCEFELKRPRKTEPLKGIIEKLQREEKVPSHIIASMDGLNSLATFGTHPKDFDPEQVRPVLINLATIIKWYIKYKDTKIISQQKPEEAKYESKELVDAREGIRKPKKKLILLLSGILIVAVIIIVVLFVFNIIGGEKQTKELEKSIAVLPFLDDSQDKENTSFINGIMDEVLINLQTIKDLRVPGRTSVEQYRNVTKSIPEIAKELGVSYIVEGSGQKYGNTFVLRIQLLEGAKDKHLWGESYEQKIDNIEDIIGIQSQIAQAIAGELKAIITPEEKQLIEKTPTTSLTAYDFYQRGREEYMKYWLDNDNKEALENAENLYNKALEYDSAFAQAYTGLAWVYWNKHYWETFFSEEFLDSVFILCDIALSYDDQLSDAYIIKGNYFNETGKTEQAEQEFDKAIKFNPNDWMAYSGKGNLYSFDDLVKVIDNLLKAASLNRGLQLPGLLRYIGDELAIAGFTDKAKKYYHEALTLDGDSIMFYINSGVLEEILGNYNNAIEFYLKGYEIDSNRLVILEDLAYNYMFMNQFEESLKYYKKEIEGLKASGRLPLWHAHRIGYVYWQNGYKKEAEYYFDKQIEYDKNEIKLGRLRSELFYTYYDLAGVYAFRGEKEKAYENLRIFNQRKIEGLWMVNLIKTDPLFNSIRYESEFQQIVRDIEAKYQAEHERVRIWLEEQGIL